MAREKMSTKTKSENVKSFRAKALRILGLAFKIFLVVSFVWPIYFVVLYKFVPVYVTPLMVQRFFEGDEKSKWATKTWVSYDEISEQMPRAVISSEDNLFPKHSGFSFENIKKSIEDHQKGKRLRGGSTISQQCAKNVFLFHSRSFVRKAYEAYFTVLIELIWGKKRIMEVYLNVIETGPGVYGVEAASQKYFNIPASKLDKNQCALIAACLPNPRKYLIAKPSNYIKGRQVKIINLMPKMGKIELE